jgi:hypothetical protein
MNIREFIEATEGLDPETPVLVLVNSGKFKDVHFSLDVLTTHGGKVVLG